MACFRDDVYNSPTRLQLEQEHLFGSVNLMFPH